MLSYWIKTYLKQFGLSILAPDGARQNILAPDGHAKTYLRQMGQNKLAPDGSQNKLAPDEPNILAPEGAKTNLRQMAERTYLPDGITIA